MIADLDESIRQLLIAELPIKNGEIEVSFHQPKREWSSRLSRPTINFFLYDLRENAVLRQHGWERMEENGRGDQLAKLRRTPFRVDCFYMLTSWAAEPEDEHRLLSRCLMALFRHPSLPEDKLTGTLKGQPFEVQCRLASHDKLTDPAEVWSSLDNEMRPSISFIVTIALNPWAEVAEPIVRTLTLRSGRAARRPRPDSLAEDEYRVEKIYIGGRVRGKNDEPVGDITVAVKGTGWVSKTNPEGRFVLGGLNPGEYTLIAWPAEGKPVERKVKVPASDGNYDIEV